MIKTTKSQTNHIITYLNNYTIDCSDEEYLKYEYAYAKIDYQILRGITEFKQNWHNGISRREKQFFEFSIPIILIESNYIFQVSNENKNGFEFFKFDSLSFLKDKPDFTNNKTYLIKGGITCYSDFYTIDTERIRDGLYYSSIIYRSPRYTYSRIEELLKNYRQDQEK